MTASRPPFGAVRDRAVNHGDKTRVLASDPRKPLVDISVAEAQAFTCIVTARFEDPAPTGGVYPLVQLEWGNGGASVVAREYRVYRRLRLPIVGSTVKLSGRMADAQGKALPKGSTARCVFTAFVAPGSDGQTLRNTQWIAQYGAEGLVSAEAEQLVTVQGYPAAPVARWLMLFDATTRPANGAFPAMATPAGRRFRLRRFDGQGFRFGVYWAASSTPIALTFDPAADLRVDVEVLT